MRVETLWTSLKLEIIMLVNTKTLIIHSFQHLNCLLGKSSTNGFLYILVTMFPQFTLLLGFTFKEQKEITFFKKTKPSEATTRPRRGLLRFSHVDPFISVHFVICSYLHTLTHICKPAPSHVYTSSHLHILACSILSASEQPNSH